MTGFIARLTDRGFGFIQSWDCPTDVFFHASALTNAAFDALTPGQPVEFDLGVDRGRRDERPRAVTVSVVEP